MGNFKGSGRKKGNFNFKPDKRERGFRDDRTESGRRDQTESKATCYKCGKPCKVPFIPTGNKPVYCRDCFRKPNERSHSARERDMPGPDAEGLEQINAKLDKIMRALNIK